MSTTSATSKELLEKEAKLRATQTYPEKIAETLGKNRGELMKILADARHSAKDLTAVSFVVLQGEEALKEWIEKPFLRIVSAEVASKILDDLRKRSGARLPETPPPLGMWVEATINGRKTCKYMF